jgi:hypothetical protein
LCISTVNSAQLASGTGKKKQPSKLPEDVPVERTTQLIPDHFQLKEDLSSRASSSTQNKDYMQTLSSDISQLSAERNNVNVAQSYLPEEYKPEEWMLADQESGVLSQLNLAIVGYYSSCALTCKYVSTLFTFVLMKVLLICLIFVSNQFGRSVMLILASQHSLGDCYTY